MSDGTPSIGARCSLSSCNLIDFLPIRCKCHNLYCADHIAPDIHDCSQQQTAQSPGTGLGALKLQRCAAQSCNKPSLESFIANPSDTTNRSPAVCSGCQQAFCAQHREPFAHSCAPLPNTSSSVPEKNSAAKALLAKHFGTATTPTTARPSTSSTKPNPKKEAQQRQVAAMKMRHKAQPGDPKDSPASVPVDQRLHLRVSQAAVSASERIFWFRKTIVTGRALDMLATHFKMTVNDTQPLKLVYADGDTAGTPLRTDQPLGDQVQDGSSLALTR